VLLAGAAVWPPVSAAVAAYGGTLLVAADGALGMNGRVFPLARTWMPPFRRLRAPARFGAIVQLALGVLSAFGLARLARSRPRLQVPLTLACLTLTAVEYAPHPLALMQIPRQPAPMYTWLAQQPPGTVTLELPVPTPQSLPRLDPLYMYFSTRHWQPLVNGYSGHYSPRYIELLSSLEGFPGPRADAELEATGVQLVIVHAAFYGREHDATIEYLDASPKYRLVAAAPDGYGQARAYAFLPGWARCGTGPC
jgi:hypothetical protein